MKSQKCFHLIGRNIRTSLSPLIHNKLFQIKEMLHYNYSLKQQGTLPYAQQLICDANFGGMSITIPFKRSYYQRLKLQSNPHQLKQIIKYKGHFAQRSKIINTLVKNKEGQLMGFNTDIYGIQKVLRNVTHVGNVLIFGAGATSETFCQYFQNNKSCQNIYIQNRSISKVNQLSINYNKIININDYDNKKVFFIVNTLPSQVLEQNIDRYQKILQKINFNEEFGYMDVNYRGTLNTLEKLFVNNKINKYSGLDMLIWQAIQQNRLFCQDFNESNQKLTQQYYNILKNLIKQSTKFNT